MAVDFALNVRQWVEKAGVRVELATYAVGQAALARVKELTPVDTGFLRSSWILVNEHQRNALSISLQEAASSFVGEVGRETAKNLAVRSGVGVLSRFNRVAGFAVEKALGVSTGADDVSLEGTIGGVAGAWAGAAKGAAIGTATAGPLGGVVGAIVGGTLGTLAGTAAGELQAGSLVRIAADTPLEGIVGIADKALGGTKLGTILYLMNPAPYARRIEYGFVGEDSLGRMYDYKGVGMMQQTISELPQIAAKALAEMDR